MSCDDYRTRLAGTRPPRCKTRADGRLLHHSSEHYSHSVRLIGLIFWVMPIRLPNLSTCVVALSLSDFFRAFFPHRAFRTVGKARKCVHDREDLRRENAREAKKARKKSESERAAAHRAENWEPSRHTKNSNPTRRTLWEESSILSRGGDSL